MITLPWLAYNLFFPISQVGKATIAVSTPTVNKTVWVPGFVNPDGPITRIASPEAVIMRADPGDPPSNDTSDQEILRTTRAMERPPRSDTPFFNETTQFPRKVPAKPKPLPRPIPPTDGPNLVHHPSTKEEGPKKERRSSPQGSPQGDPSSHEYGRTKDHPWSMQGYDCDDPRGLQDVTYSRGEACIKKMKVRHIRNATLHVLQKLEYEKKTGAQTIRPCTIA